MDAMLRRALRKYAGLRHHIDRVLLGDDDGTWEAELKKFLRRETCWIKEAPVAITAIPTTPVFLPVPADGEEFELTINGDEVDPLGMVKGGGISNWQEYEFIGPRVTGTHTSRFKFGRPGPCSDTAAVEQRLGKLAEGQWREPFRQRYPHPDDQGPIGFGGSKWVGPGGFLFFPALHGGSKSWVLCFDWSSLNRRWLVDVSK